MGKPPPLNSQIALSRNFLRQRRKLEFLISSAGGGAEGGGGFPDFPQNANLPTAKLPIRKRLTKKRGGKRSGTIPEPFRRRFQSREVFRCK